MSPTLRAAIVAATIALTPHAARSAQGGDLLDDSIVAAPLAYGAGVRQLYRLDLGNRTGVALGTYGSAGGQEIADIEGLAFAPNGTLFGVSDPAKGLYRLNISTGRATFVARFEQSLRDAPSLDLGLAFTCDGRAWIASDEMRRLWELNPTDGSTRFVANTPVRLSGLAARGNELFGISVSGQNDVSLDQSIYRIDTATGELTRIGSFQTPLPIVDAGLDFDEEGRLWATFDYNPQPGSNPAVVDYGDLAEIDPETGGLLSRTPMTWLPRGPEGGIEGLAITSPCNVPAGGPPPAPLPVPAASAGASGLLALLLALLGLTFLRRRAAA